MIDITQEDRQFVLDRLDDDHIDEVALQVRTLLSKGSAVEACYQPGDGTWYPLLFARPTLVGAPGGGSGGSLPTSKLWRDRTFVTWIDHHSHGETSFDSTDDPEWVAMKIETTPASQLAIAELIRRIQRGSHRPRPDYDPHIDYPERYTDGPI